MNYSLKYLSRTIDSKIDENRCEQKFELIQVMGDLYRHISVVMGATLDPNFLSLKRT